jgi:phage gpG-like protein
MSDSTSSVGIAILGAMKTWVAKSRLYVVNTIRDKFLAGQVLKRRTGTLVRSIADEASETNDSFTVGTSVVYGVGWELGFTRPAFTVVPIRAKALRFAVGGEFIFRRRANIPAKTFAARPFIQPGLDQSVPYMTDTAENEFSKAIGNSFQDRVIRVTRS